MKLESFLKKYDYSFPESLIAQAPARPRDAARLLVFDRKTKVVKFDIYRNIGKFLPKNAVLVFNKTKVVPARIEVKKHTGGKAKLLYIETKNNVIKVISDRKLSVGNKLFITSKIYFTIISQEENFYILKASFNLKKLFNILEKYGSTPIPPYIKHSKLSEKKLRQEYQTVFAKEKGSVAAPTASLHFTKALLSKLKKQGFKIEFVTLHVNLGTFATLTETNIASKKLHTEYFEIDSRTAKRLNLAKREGRPIVGVGTTVVRTLESAVNQKGQITKLNGTTDLFIQENYKFKFITAIATNFHVPKSSLIMLVSAFTGRRTILELYKKAVSKKFRLFSFGDGMLLK